MLCRKYVVKTLAQQLRPQLEATVKHNDDPSGQKYSPDSKSAARRALKNKALAYLAALGDAAITQQVLNRFGAATNMTDKISALAALIDSEGMLQTPPALAPCLCKVSQGQPVITFDGIVGHPPLCAHMCYGANRTETGSATSVNC